MKNYFLLFLVFSFLSCSIFEPSVDTTPIINIENPQFYSSYCIYLAEGDERVSIEFVEALLHDLLPSYTSVDSIASEIGKNEYTIFQEMSPKENIPAPDREYLKHAAHDLSAIEIEKLQNPEEAVLITFSGVKEDVKKDQFKINLIIDSLLQSTGGIVLDYVTYEAFNSKSWNLDRVISLRGRYPDITSQVTIHMYREEEFCRAVTLGMGKFCLPDISLSGYSCNSSNTFASLINLIIQTLSEEPRIAQDSVMLLSIDQVLNDSLRTWFVESLEDNAEKKGIVRLRSVKPQEGDDFNTQLEIVFEDPKYTSPSEQQQELVSKIFGGRDEISYIKHSDAILEASNAAKKKLPKFKKIFKGGLDPGCALLLKAPFVTDTGGKEWMWIEVIEWENESISGILQNDPFHIKSLKAGSIVKTLQGDIFDYIYYHADGSSEGNKTGELIKTGQ